VPALIPPTPIVAPAPTPLAPPDTLEPVSSSPPPLTAINIVVNEIMANPAAVDDQDGEWFELYNAGSTAVDINGWTFRDDNAQIVQSFTIDTSTVIEPGGYLVLGNMPDTLSNGGVTIDYVYPSSFLLANDVDELIVTDATNTEQDRVDYTSASFPIPNGASLALASPDLDNNVGGNWCTASTAYGSGDQGTPGAANDC
jgi:uncharacterized protein